MTGPPSSVPDTRPRSLEQRVEIETPEQVVFAYTVAGIGSRTAAGLLDLVLMGLVSFTIWIGIAFLANSLPRVGSFLGPWAMALGILLQFAIFWTYFVLFEALWDGQTPGKRRMGLRVVQDGGYSISFAASAVRNLARAIDMQPGLTYAVGIIAAATSRNGKRLGDLLAGTMVVHERITQAPSAPARVQSSPGGVPPSLSALLTEREYELLDRFLARRGTLETSRRVALTEQLATRFAAHLPVEGNTPLARLIVLHGREQSARKHGLSARGNVGAAREQHAIVARSMPRWSDFAGKLAEAQQKGLRRLSEEEVSEFVALYREVSTDLARLRTASQGAEPESLFYVSRLVGAGHNLLYRQRPLVLSKTLRFMAVTVPTEIRRSAVPILLATVCLFSPMVITASAIVSNPALATDLVPPQMIDRAEEGVQRARRGEGYITISDFERPIMATTIIANNVQITYGAFALGVTAGLGTLFVLLFNGLAIGAGFGIYASKGILSQIVAFVLPHGVLELTAVCIAGGGGLLIGSALLIPGALTRREALVVRTRRAVRLVAASTLFLLVAGLIEGLVSARPDVPMAARIMIASGTGVLIALYIAFGRGPEDEVAEDFAYSDARAFTSR